MTDLIQKVRVVLKYMSKAKAAKLVRGLVDMFLEMKTANQDDNGELGVQVCKVSTMKVKCLFLLLIHAPQIREFVITISTK